ncbi:MAG: hypothetical protein ACE5JK_04680 [Candidatus Omnitrophota bacterium]
MRKMVLFVLVIAVACVFATGSYAAEKDPVQYTGNVVTGSVKTVGEAAEGTAKTAVSPIEALWNFLTGKGKGEKIVTEPVERGGRTIKRAGEDTGKTLRGEKW